MAATRLTNADLRLQYQNLFDSCIIKPDKRVEVEQVITRILAH
jgi:lysozyme family protein